MHYIPSYTTAIAAVLAIFGMVACSDDVPPLNLVPNLHIISLQPDTVLAGQDSLTLTFSYTDGDGDLGHPDPNRPTIQLTDSRLPTPDNYYLLPLVAIDSNIAISGTIHLRISPTFVLGNQIMQSFRYSVVLIDRAGHYSQPALSPPVVVVRP